MLNIILIVYCVIAVLVLWFMLDYRYRENDSDLTWWAILFVAITWPFWAVWFAFDSLAR